MMKRLSISDIADKLGVSVTTVSLVLNGKAKESRISDMLTKRVLDYANKVGYIPSSLKKNSLSVRFKTVCLLVDSISSPFYSAFISAVEKVAITHNCRVVSFGLHEGNSVDLLEYLRDKHFDGFIISPSPVLNDVIESFLKSNIPLVFFERNIEGLNVNSVVSDNFNGAFIGTKSMFVDKGASRVGFVSTNSNLVHLKNRLLGYMQAVDEVGKDFFIKKVNLLDSVESVVDDIKDFILVNRLDSVFFAVDELMPFGLRAILEYSLPVVHFVAFDVNELFSFVTPKLSVVKQDVDEMALQSIVLLKNSMNSTGTDDANHIVVPCDFVIR